MVWELNIGSCWRCWDPSRASGNRSSSQHCLNNDYITPDYNCNLRGLLPNSQPSWSLQNLWLVNFILKDLLNSQWADLYGFGWLQKFCIRNFNFASFMQKYDIFHWFCWIIYHLLISNWQNDHSFLKVFEQNSWFFELNPEFP